MNFSRSSSTPRFTQRERELMAMAHAELELRRRAQLKVRLERHTSLLDLELLDFIPALTPTMLGEATERPEHLAPIADAFERIKRGEVIRELFSAPPQHAKTQTICHGIAQLIARDPARPVVYASYAANIAQNKSRIIRDYARQLGVEMRDDSDSVGDWITPQGGGLRARGIGQGLTGEPAKLLFVDDPHKDRAEAESALMRQRAIDWFTSVAMSRIHPDTSVVIDHARWHPDDLIGRLTTMRSAKGEPVWRYTNLPAISPGGQPLWHRRPLDFLEAQRRLNEYDWDSLWMGNPRVRGDSVFRGVGFFEQLPRRYYVTRGCDLAYSAKTRACYSVGVTMLVSLDPLDARPDGEPVCYVVDVRRKRLEVPDFARELQAAEVLWRGGGWHWFRNTVEAGTAQLMRELGVPVEDVLATQDKFSRAQPAAAAWNAGRILVPKSIAALRGERALPADHEREPEWLRDYVDELGAFTGADGETNDQVDATASAYEGCRYGGPGGGGTLEGDGSRWGDERGFG
jgi:phage terminase large subunit-like protein